MKQLRWNFTLPELQAQLDLLAEGALFRISARDYERCLERTTWLQRASAISRKAMHVSETLESPSRR